MPPFMTLMSSKPTFLLDSTSLALVGIRDCNDSPAELCQHCGDVFDRDLTCPNIATIRIGKKPLIHHRGH
ncbi:hypothetical protein C8N31_106162 [Sulfitobacter mediterraneus]|uniref:Uncharacterized protein n=1 Tax=Sulfitobacter mediterraneus TaxID=83219 RepID=A0A2T6CDV7_9RHOB|nr:hypothetical protein C8N31_106162 [Sulfitobacter mediterraneus]